MSKSPRIRIRKANAGDIFGIQEVFYDAWTKADPVVNYEPTVAEFKDMYSQRTIRENAYAISHLPENEFILVATEGSMVVGFVRGIVHEDENRLVAMFVDPTHQRRGIGTRLWKKALRIFDMSKPVMLDVGTSNALAQNFYFKLGFTALTANGDFPEMQLIYESPAENSTSIANAAKLVGIIFLAIETFAYCEAAALVF